LPVPAGHPGGGAGETYTEETIAYVEEIVANGGFVEGAADQSLNTFRVVARTD
jgi:hypothetical protein